MYYTPPSHSASQLGNVTTTSSGVTASSIITAVIGVVVVLTVVGLAFGLGLGFGLNRGRSDSNSTSATTLIMTATTSIRSTTPIFTSSSTDTTPLTRSSTTTTTIKLSTFLFTSGSTTSATLTRITAAIAFTEFTANTASSGSPTLIFTSGSAASVFTSRSTSTATRTTATVTTEPSRSTATTASFVDTTSSPSPCACGCSPINTTALLSRVINGAPATANSWPWMVHVRMSDLGTCGGFLISSQHVITAAHCVPNLAPSRVQVYAGLQKLSLLSSAEIRNVSAISSHPDYNQSMFKNDIAVLKLSSSYPISSKIGACCLPPSGTSLPIINEKALVMGWGRTAEGIFSSIPDDLLQAVVQIQNSSATCTASSINFCAGLGTTDTCQGDSGGPLLTSVNNQLTCTGIVSSGVGCRGFGSYTRVSAFRSFIDSAMQTL